MNIVGQVLDDRYKILRPIGKGGMAEVFLAMDLNLKRDGTPYPDSRSAVLNCRNMLMDTSNISPRVSGNIIYHSLPLSALKNGDNYIVLTAINGPAQAFIQRLTYTEVKILLKK